MPTKLRKIHNFTKFRGAEFTLNIPLIAGWEIVKELCPKKLLQLVLNLQKNKDAR